MLVKEFIEILKKEKPDAKVRIYFWDGEKSRFYVPTISKNTTNGVLLLGACQPLYEDRDF